MADIFLLNLSVFVKYSFSGAAAQKLGLHSYGNVDMVSLINFWEIVSIVR